jgi:hypothetical protein
LNVKRPVFSSYSISLPCFIGFSKYLESAGKDLRAPGSRFARHTGILMRIYILDQYKTADIISSGVQAATKPRNNDNGQGRIACTKYMTQR